MINSQFTSKRVWQMLLTRKKNTLHYFFLLLIWSSKPLRVSSKVKSHLQNNTQ